MFFALPCFAQQPDSSHVDTTTSIHNIKSNEHVEDDDFNIFLAVFGIITLSVMAGIAILTVVVAGGALICVGALIAVGALSVSVGVGIYRRSYTSGIKTAVYIGSAILGCIGGTVLGWFTKKLFQIHVSNTNALLTGAAAGVIGGCIGAACLIWLTRILYKQFATLKNQ